MNNEKFYATTILAVKKEDSVSIGGDGQVTLGNTIMKSGARKIRRMYNDTVLTGFAGATADALTLFEKFEGYLEKNDGNIKKSAVELTKEWRTNKIMHKLEAMLIACNKDALLILSGNGDVIEPDDNIAAIGSGAGFAASAAKALCRNTEMPASKIVEESLKIAAELCIYTNDKIVVETL